MGWRDRGATLKETHSWTELYKAIRIEYPELKSKTDGQIRDGIRYKLKSKTVTGKDEILPAIQDKGNFFIVTSGTRSIEITKEKLK